MMVRQGLDHPAYLVDPQAIFRDKLAQEALICTCPGLCRTLKVRQILFCDLHRLGFVGHYDINDTIRSLYGNRADLLGRKNAESAALDHSRSPHADGRVLRRDDDIAATQQGGIACETAPRDDAYQRY